MQTYACTKRDVSWLSETDDRVDCDWYYECGKIPEPVSRVKWIFDRMADRMIFENPRGEHIADATTTAERKEKKRAKKRKAGYMPIKVWCKPEHKQKMNGYAAELINQGERKV